MEAFRDQVIAIGARRFPDMKIRSGRVPSEVATDVHVLYLGNIYAQVRDIPEPAREAAIADWLSRFTPAADARANAIRAATDDWPKAQPLLRPKLLARVAPTVLERLIWQPFHADLVVLTAVDLGDKDLYVSKSKAAGWGVPEDAVRARAIANLEDLSSGLGRDPVEKNALINIRTSDGYDAARLLLPGLRARFCAVLGSPYHAAAPTRDLLMCWRPGDAAFEGEMANLVQDAAAGTTRPVSSRVFAADDQGVRPL